MYGNFKNITNPRDKVLAFDMVIDFLHFEFYELYIIYK